MSKLRAGRRCSCAALCVGSLALGCGAASTTGDTAAASFYDCVTEPRAVPANVGLVRTSSMGLTATLTTLMPLSLVKGNNAWRVGFRDAAGHRPQGASVTVLPFMPDHGHGASVKVGAKDLGDGAYELVPIYLYMAGYWEISVSVTPPGGLTDTVMFPVCVPG